VILKVGEGLDQAYNGEIVTDWFASQLHRTFLRNLDYPVEHRSHFLEGEDAIP